MEVAEQRAANPVSLLESVELGVEGVGQFACPRLIVCQTARGDVELLAIARDEFFPCAADSVSTGAGQHEVLSIERTKIRLYFHFRHAGESISCLRTDAGVDRVGHRLRRQTPFFGAAAMREF